MSLLIASLNSGSNGNCYYIGNATDAVLIDAGISCRETEKRMKRAGLQMQKVRAIFVSHEHTDHISGVSVLSKKFQLPVYITPGTLQKSSLQIETHCIIPFKPYESVAIGALNINAFPKFHDAQDPHSFTVSCNAVTVGIFTDIGNCCQHVINHFKQCHAAFLEANYDTAMLAAGSYPYHLKKRISGGNGHLSNAEALNLFTTHRPPFMSHLILSHLSKNNNEPQLVQQLFNRYADGTEIIVAPRYQETKVYEINNADRLVMKSVKKQQHFQLSMF